MLIFIVFLFYYIIFINVPGCYEVLVLIWRMLHKTVCTELKLFLNLNATSRVQEENLL